MSTQRTPIPGECHYCDAPVPNVDAATVVRDVGPHCAVQYPVCKSCYTPEFRAYLDECEAFWRGEGK